MPDYFVAFKSDDDKDHNKWFIGEFADRDSALAHCNANADLGPRGAHKFVDGAADYTLIEIEGDGSRTAYALRPSD